MKRFNQDYDDCEYSERTAFEYDTGYAEYECTLYGGECYGEDCPLSFDYCIEA